MTLPYIHLSLAERREIARMHAAKIPISVIADRLQRHRSTIYREIKRNWVHDEEPLYRGYYHVAADMQARARRQRLSKLSRKPVLAVYVMDRLKAGWSPELPAQASRSFHSGEQHHRAASTGDRSPHQLWSLGRRSDDVPQGTGQAQPYVAY
jgi:transposase, IS30 family